jgi:hypothetical protein
MAVVVKYQGVKGLSNYLIKNITRRLMSKNKHTKWQWNKPVTQVFKAQPQLPKLKQRVIFLDINGVLYSGSTIETAEREFEKSNPKPVNIKEIKNWYEKKWGFTRMSFNEDIIERIATFAKANNAAVVISSTSRNSMQGDDARKCLSDYGVTIGPPLKHGCSMCEKGNEIRSYMTSMVKMGKSQYYVIFDDGLDFLIAQDSHLVIVDSKTGLTQHDIEWAQEIFDELGIPEWYEDKPISQIALYHSQYNEHLSPEEKEQLSFPGYGDKPEDRRELIVGL